MDYKARVESLTPAMYEELRLALELGKWSDGNPLSSEQKANCMDAIIHWELKHKAPHERTGYIDRGTKSEQDVCDSEQVLELKEATQAPEPGPKE